MNPTIAARIGRTDLAAQYGGARMASTSGATYATAGVPAGISASAGVNAGSLGQGQISLGMLGLIVLGLGAFVIWTRHHQL